MTEITWAVTVLSIAGTVLNIKRKKCCFAIWCATNGFWAVYDFIIGAYAQAALFAVYLGLSLWGLWEWRCGHE